MYRTLRQSIQRGRAVFRRMHLALLHPVSQALIKTNLAAFSPPRQIVMVHSSLSSCGYLTGGAEAAIRLIREWVGTATLVMPTHTYCYADANGQAEIFDPVTTPSRVGVISDTFWRQPRVLRSLHPSHSLAASGVLASEIVFGHDRCKTPCGSGTPYRKLVDEDAGILMFGTSLDSYTLFHTSEDAASVPYLYEPAQCLLRLREPTGVVREIPMQRQDMTIMRRFAKMDSWLEAHGLLQRRRCGRGELIWLPHAAMVHAALTKELQINPSLLLNQIADVPTRESYESVSKQFSRS